MTFKLSEIGLVPVDWEISELKTKATITMGQSPKSDSYNSECIGMPFMQGRKTFGDKYHSIDTWCTDPKKIAKRNDVLISVRAPVGDVNVATTDLCIGRGLASLRMHNGNNEFLYYLLKNYSKEITNRETGTVFASINKKGLETIKLPFPSDIEQKAIANILSTLDEKIETNNQINEKLEEMAQAIFKHWFVDFEFPNENGEPYKTSGGEMVESELGLIPIDWKIGDIYNIIDVKYGAAYKSKQFNENGEGLPLIRIRDLKNANPLFYTTEKHPNETIVNIGDILLGMDAEFTPTIWKGKKAYLNQRVCQLKPNKDYVHKYYVYELIKPFMKFYEHSKVGTTVIHLGKADIDKIRICIPTKEVLKEFSILINPIFQKILEVSNENLLLKEIRDTLLPKLMSGEIRVPVEE